MRLTTLILAGLMALMPAPALADTFEVAEGMADNTFLSDGPVAAHLMLTSGRHPRIIVAFPAGNSGAGLFLQPTDRPVHFTRTGPLEAVNQTDADGIPLHGLKAHFTLDAASLTITRADLGSLRFARGAVNPASVAPRGALHTEIGDTSIHWARARTDGKSSYDMTLTLANGTVSETADGIVLMANGGQLDMALTVLTGDQPLTPLTGNELLTPDAAQDPRLRDALGFLATREKLMAGSWRFLTYFGRDTLLSVRLLMPVLGRPAIEAGLGSVIERLNKAGEVAHEEAIGELAVLMNQHDSGEAVDRPVNDYGMVDDNLMLLPVLADYLVTLADDDARAFLARKAADGQPYGDALARNIGFVLAIARPFAKNPAIAHLVSLKPGEPDGNWRDSEEGLGRGRYPYDVNAVLMPAALKAIARMAERGLINAPADEAAHLASVWEREAVKPFMVTVPADAAQAQVTGYARDAGVPVVLPEGDIRFHALALDADGKPIPVQHSDDGFDLLFGKPDAQRLSDAIAALERPYPAGLMTPVGMLVANAAFAGEKTRALFGRGHYHGAVVWSWQQAMWAAGLKRQLARTDLPAALSGRLASLQCKLWQAIDAGRDIRNSELWSWLYADGRYQVEPFGQGEGHLTESNAVQLWSTVYLAVTPPERGTCQN